MATRLLILDDTGRPRYGLDGHHGERHAAEWAAAVLAELAAQGIAGIALQIHPFAGGDVVRREVIGQLHRLRAEIRVLPDGRREIIALNRYPEAEAGDPTLPDGRSKRQHAKAPEAVLGALRVVLAPTDIANPRTPIRIPRGRANVPAGLPRTIDEQRAARRAARAVERHALKEVPRGRPSGV